MFQCARFWCDCCGNGLVAFVLAADGRRVVMFCLNCGTWYPSDAHDRDGALLVATPAEGPDLVLRGVGISVRFPPARWATAEEVRGFGWGDHLDKGPPPDWRPEDQEWWPRRLWGII